MRQPNTAPQEIVINSETNEEGKFPDSCSVYKKAMKLRDDNKISSIMKKCHELRKQTKTGRIAFEAL